MKSEGYKSCRKRAKHRLVRSIAFGIQNDLNGGYKVVIYTYKSIEWAYKMYRGSNGLNEGYKVGISGCKGL